VTECANEGETHLQPRGGLVYRVYETVRGAEEPQLVAGDKQRLNATVRLADDAGQDNGHAHLHRQGIQRP